MPEARRTLVKSPPELWAELSDPESLARHLEAFGEIRITRLDPESTVAWEGDRARGTVELSASGWGTKVTITAETVAEEPVLQQPLAVVEEPQPEPEAVAEVEEEAVEEPEPAPAPEPPRKKGFFARLFGRKSREVDAPEPETAVAPEPGAVAPPEPEAVAPPEPEVVAPPEPVAEEITVTRLGDDEAQSVLDGVLDALGAAHHRPFSR